MGIDKKLRDSLEWYDRIKGFLAPFKPEAKSVSLNHRNRNCEIRLALYVPNGIRRRVAKIEIPALAGFRIVELMDEGFAQLPNAFYLDANKWRFDTTKLTSSEKFLATMEGNIDSKSIESLVRIQPAKNRDQTDDLDRYWLDSMIRDVETLEEVWKAMQVEDVDVSVNVSIEKCFASVLPEDIKERLDATAKYLEAGQTTDRQKFFGAWRRYRTITKNTEISIEDFVKVSRALVAPEGFSNYLSVDSPYRLGRVSAPITASQSAFPDQVNVEATTSLNYKSPAATGYLSFKKKLFTDAVLARMSRIF